MRLAVVIVLCGGALWGQDRAAFRTAIEKHDNPGIIAYGERILARDPADITVLERVIQALRESGDPRELQYVRQYQDLRQKIEYATPPVDIRGLTLSGPAGDRLSLASLQGKTLVLNFWTTWCVPCREEHRLLQKVQARFQDNPEVVFLSIAGDEDRRVVKPFLAAHDWQDPAWFAGGLSDALDIKAYPTTLVIDRTGRVSARMNGFTSDTFTDTLARKIEQAIR
jgi:thiol-disulfide isomerase/thioredoxin